MATSPTRTPWPDKLCVSQGETARRPIISYRSSKEHTSTWMSRGTRNMANAVPVTLTTKIESRIVMLIKWSKRARGNDGWPLMRCVGSMFGRTSILRFLLGPDAENWYCPCAVCSIRRICICPKQRRVGSTLPSKCRCSRDDVGPVRGNMRIRVRSYQAPALLSRGLQQSTTQVCSSPRSMAAGSRY